MRKMFLGRGDHSPLRSRGLPDLLPFARGTMTVVCMNGVMTMLN
jgi:hypothetical protein